MTNMWVLLIAACAAAGCSDYRAKSLAASARAGGPDEKPKRERVFTLLVILILGCFAGLRTDYNDTYVYLNAFNNHTQDIWGFLRTADFSLSENMGFRFTNSLIRTVTDNEHIYLMIYSMFTVSVHIWFMRKYSDSLLMSVFIYVASGFFLFNCAAIKQCVAIAFGLIAIDFALRKKWAPFLIFMCVGTLFHPYMMIMIIAPLLIAEPWKGRTYMVLVVTVAICTLMPIVINIITALTSTIGEAYTDESFSGDGISIPTLLIAFVPVALSLIFQNDINPTLDRPNSLAINLSIVKFAITFIALFGTANYFGRLALYFAIFPMIALPRIMLKLDDRAKVFFIYCFVVCYLILYWYVTKTDGVSFRAITFSQFFETLRG